MSSFVVKIQRTGSHETSDINEISPDWPVAGLNQGGTFEGAAGTLSAANEITVIPVLRGTSKSGARTHTCDEQYGQDIIL